LLRVGNRGYENRSPGAVRHPTHPILGADALSIAGIVLAAGFSSRMGEFKPLLPIGGRPALERAACCLLDAGVSDVRVVVGYRADELIALLNRLPVTVVVNPRYREGMFSSLVAGVSSFGHPGDDSECMSAHVHAFFMLPVDVPLVAPRTIRQVSWAFVNHPFPSLVAYPVYGGRRGHPPLISIALRERILTFDGEGGMRALLKQVACEAPERFVDVPVDDPAIHLDMDTPDDYRALKEQWGRYEGSPRGPLGIGPSSHVIVRGSAS
jgi:molybdenum cofactor cytidylyltransferase